MTEQSITQRGAELMRSGDTSIDFYSDDPAVLEQEAGSLISANNFNVAHLGCVLFQLQDRGRHVDRGYNTFKDYVENELNYSWSKARNYIKSWECFQDLALPPAMIPNISWTKFTSLVPLVERGIIDKESVTEWLPLVEPEGPHALRVADIQAKVGRELADSRAAGATSPQDIERVSLPVKTEDRGDFERNLQLCKEHFNEESGDTVLQRMAAHCASSIMSGSMDTERIGSLLNLKKTAETVAPEVTTVFISNSSEPIGGVIPVTHVYWCGDPTNMVLAIGPEDAAECLGCSVDELSKSSLTVTDEAAQNTPTAAPAAVDVPENTEDLSELLIQHARTLADVDPSFKSTYQAKFREVSDQVADEDIEVAMFTWVHDYAATAGVAL